MKNELYSHNSLAQANAKHFLLPSLAQLLLYILVSFLLLVFLDSYLIWQHINYRLADGNLAQILNDNSPSVHRFLTHLPQGRIVQVIFWVVLGSSLYILFWFFKNVATNVRNDLIATEYLHPATFDKSTYWRSIIVRKIFFGGSLLILLSYLFSAIKLITILASTSFYALLTGWASGLLISLGSVIVVVAMVHLLVILSRIVVHSWRFIYADL